MRLKPFFARIFAVIAFIVPFALDAWAAEGDVAGASDFKDIGRFQGSVITGYDARDFDEYKFIKGPADDPGSVQMLEGRVTRIAYRTDPGPSIAEVFRNYKAAIEAAGFKAAYDCDADSCKAPDIPYAVLPIPQMWADGFNYRYLAATRGDPARGYVTLLVSENNGNIFAEIDMIEVQAMQNKIVSAKEMETGLEKEGHIALYGVYFDTGSAAIKAESAPTMEQMAALLKGAPELQVVIVGHTDSQGGYDYNMNLSQHRAQAVLDALVTTYKIDRARLRAAGVGYLAPRGANATEEGRQLNRRVELVVP